MLRYVFDFFLIFWYVCKFDTFKKNDKSNVLMIELS